MLLLKFQRGGHLVRQMLHGRLIGVAVIANPLGVVQFQHSHQFALREHWNKDGRARPARRLSLRKNGLRRVSGMAISVRLRKQAAIPAAMPLLGLPSSMDSMAAPEACTLSSDFVPRFSRYIPVPEEAETLGSVISSRRRISAGDAAPITSSPKEFRTRMRRRSAAIRRSRNHQIASTAAASITEASSNGGGIIQAFSTTAIEAGPGAKIWKNRSYGGSLQNWLSIPVTRIRSPA